MRRAQSILHHIRESIADNGGAEHDGKRGIACLCLSGAEGQVTAGLQPLKSVAAVDAVVAPLRCSSDSAMQDLQIRSLSPSVSAELCL